MSPRAALSLTVLALTMAACSKGSGAAASAAQSGSIVIGQPAHPDNPSYKNSGLASMGKDTIAQHQVVEMLHGDQMILIPDVQKKTQEFVKMYRDPANHVTREQAAAKFSTWLQTYAAQHPDEVAKAKAQHIGQPAVSTNPATPGPTPVPSPTPPKP